MPIADKVIFARGALDIIGSQSGIESFTENSLAARKVALFYDQVIEETLEAFDWGFARKSQLISASATDPNNGWAFRYDEPEDCIAPRRILSPLGRKADYPPFAKALVGDIKTLLTDIEQAELEFTARITNPLLFSPLFVSAGRHLLGYYVAPSILGRNGSTMQDRMERKFGIIIKRAADSDSNTEKVEEDQDPDWISDR